METTKQKLENALKDAMRANNAMVKNTIRMVLTNMKLAEVEKGAPLDENAQLALIQIRDQSPPRRHRGRNGATPGFDRQKPKADKSILETVLPNNSSEDELKAWRRTIAETGAKGR